MALVETSRIEVVVQALRERYFEPRGIEPTCIEARPSTGAGLI